MLNLRQKKTVGGREWEWDQDKKGKKKKGKKGMPLLTFSHFTYRMI